MLDFLYTAVSWVLLRWHQLFTLIGIDKDSGLNWSLSIVFLVITARLVLFRFFVKQVHYQRRMQEFQPKIAELRKKYKDDKQALQREMMKLQQEEGINPLGGCLPLLLQFPIFIGLFHVLRHLANAAQPGYSASGLTLYSWTRDETLSAAHAKLFSAPLAARLLDSPSKVALLGGSHSSLLIVTPILAIISAAATYYTQRLSALSMTTVPEGTAATVQRLMRYFIPISVLGSGIYFPLGVVLYWFASNLWTMGQQAYILRFHPATPGGGSGPGGSGGGPAPRPNGGPLAPKPGARPVTDRRRTGAKGSNGTGTNAPGADGTPADAPPADTSVTSGTPSSSGATAAGASAANSLPRTPRPGSRPNRPAGSRPSGNRPSKAKKRR